MGKRVVLRAVWAGALLATLAWASPGVGAPEALNRSIYVPIELELCEHITDAALYQDEMRVRSLPGDQIVQFTFYPDLKRLLPEQGVFHVKGKESSGRDFDVMLTVTPADVFVANHHIDLHPEEYMKDLGHKVDIHYHPVTVKLNCRDFCPLREATERRTTDSSR